MPFHHFPADFVYWENLEKHEKLKSKVLPVILKKSNEYKNNPFPGCNFNTSFFEDNRFLTENEFLYEKDFINDVVFEPLKAMVKSYNDLKLFKVQPEVSIIQGAWWNVYDKGDFQEMHTHKSQPMFLEGKMFYPAFSIVYILKDENEESSILFKKDKTTMEMPMCDYTFQTSKEEDIKEGTVLIFPYDMNHMVKPCIKPGRVTIAYNIFSSWVPQQ